MVTVDTVADIINHIQDLDGIFHMDDVMRWYGFQSIEDKSAAFGILKKAEEEGIIVRASYRAGVYRLVDTKMAIMDLDKPLPPKSPIELPFLLHEICDLYPKTVVIAAGEKDSGKTSFALTSAFMNRDHYEVRYFNSEMGESELRNRLIRFDPRRFPMSEWKKITFVERSNRFEDLILPDGLNIIDFLEIGKEAFTVTEDIARVFHKLNHGILLIVMQKRTYKEYAVGGEGTLEKARLAVNLEHATGGGICRITVAKNWNGPVAFPKGKVCGYKVVQGGEIIMTDYWHEEIIPEKKTRKKKGYDYDEDFPRE